MRCGLVKRGGIKIMRHFIGTHVVLCTAFAISGCNSSEITNHGNGLLPQGIAAKPSIIRSTPRAVGDNKRNDASGDLFVANMYDDTVTEYAPPYIGAPIVTISSNNFVPLGVALSPRRRLFVTNNSANTVMEYAPPYTGAPIATISNSVNRPNPLVFDKSGDLFVGNSTYANSYIAEYAPPYTGPPILMITLGLDIATGLAIDPKGDLFVANLRTLTEYAPPYTGAPTTISNGIKSPVGLGFDDRGHLFVTNFSGGNGNITEYAPPYTGSPIATITNGVIYPSAVVLNASRDLFVANYGSDTVTEYAPPYTGAPIDKIETGTNPDSEAVVMPYVRCPKVRSAFPVR